MPYMLTELGPQPDTVDDESRTEGNLTLILIRRYNPWVRTQSTGQLSFRQGACIFLPMYKFTR